MKRAYVKFYAWATQDAGKSPCPVAMRLFAVLGVNTALMALALGVFACIVNAVFKLIGIN